MNHKFGDGQKCRRCGIEEIYWQHFPDCSRFRPSWDSVRAAFKDEQPPSRGTMTPEKNIIDERIERVKEWMERPGTSPSFIESCKERIRMLKSQLVDISPEQEKAKKAEEVERIKTQLADERMRPFLFALVDNELGRLDKLGLPPDKKQALQEHLESIKAGNPTPYPFPKPRPGSLMASTRRRPKINPRPDIP